MGRRRITVADIKEVLVAWDAGESVSAMTRSSKCPPMAHRAW
jgi:hypothetical protein